MRAGSIGQVVESRHSDFNEGDLVQTTGCWQDYVVLAPGEGPMGLNVLPPGVPPELMLSVLGITGITAYFGLLDVAKPIAGDTVLVSGAAGATGSVAAQIARIKGCRVVGIAGGPEKCAWLTDTAKLDVALDYKAGDLDAQIGAACPEKWNVFFDNVGGSTMQAALNHISLNARIAMCGGISGYNDIEPQPGPNNLMNLVTNRGRMEGFYYSGLPPPCRRSGARIDRLGGLGGNPISGRRARRVRQHSRHLTAAVYRPEQRQAAT